MSLAEWIHTYQAHLPPHLRSAGDNQRFITAARQAAYNGWRAKQLADTITNRDYTNARNPELLAIIRLEELGATPADRPRQRRPGQHPNGCAVCAPSQTCEDPATEIPPEWRAERFTLLRILRHTPAQDMPPEERQQLMADLIHRQHTET